MGSETHAQKTRLVGRIRMSLGRNEVDLLLKPSGGCDAARASRHVLLLRHCRTGARQRLSGLELAKRLRTGIGWTPTNIMLTAFGPIAQSPWGPFGDLVLMPDPATQVDVEFGEDHPREHFFLGDVLHTDGQPWECCPRTFLKGALAALEQQAGLRLASAFELLRERR